MIFFPTIYEDELLYSAIARYHIRSGNLNQRNTMIEAFGKVRGSASVDLPSGINTLISNLPINCKYTSDMFINKHTLFPLYSSFLPEHIAKEVFNLMEGEDGRSIPSKSRLTGCNIHKFRYLRFCPECLKNDIDKYGEAYWHRIHQVPGVLICPKHKVPTENSSVKIGDYNRQSFVAATEENCKIEKVKTIYTNEIIDKLYALAKDLQFLLENTLTRRDVDWFNHNYKNYLISKGIAMYNGIINQRKLSKSFQEYYGKEFLDLVQCNINDSKYNWLAHITRDNETISHPIRHILLIRFIGIELSDIFNYKYKHNTFEEGPWPCLNKAVDHYKEHIINNVDIRYNVRTKKIYGVFKCKCGFTYTRNAPDIFNQNIYNYNYVIDYGHEWKEKLKELVESKNFKMKEVKDKLNVGDKTLNRYIDELALTPHWRRTNNHSNKNTKTNSAEKNYDMNYYQEKMNQIIKENPNMSRTELYRSNQKVYMWLRVNCNDWLEKTLPPKKNHSMKNITIVDWDNRDENILIEVKEVVNAMISSKERPERICIGIIGKKINKLKLLQKKINKLPKTQEYLKMYIEDIPTYRTRKIKWAVKELYKTQASLSISNVMSKAGIRHDSKEEVIDIINDEISKYSI